MTVETTATFGTAFRVMADQLASVVESLDEHNETQDAERARDVARKLRALGDGLDAAQADGPPRGGDEQDRTPLNVALAELAEMARQRDPEWVRWWSGKVPAPLWQPVEPREVRHPQDDGDFSFVKLGPLVHCPRCHGSVEQQWAKTHSDWHEARDD